MDIRPGIELVGPDGQTITVTSQIGQGGFGLVFKGEMRNREPVAIKTLSTGLLDSVALAAFQHEADVAAAFDHPNVVRVLHVEPPGGNHPAAPYLVMEFVEGGTLADIVEANRSSGTLITVSDAVALFRQIAAGMQFVNSRVVHRDLKPGNILIDRVAANTPKIADFGLSKFVSAATRSQTFKGAGTLAYQSPESFTLEENSPAMDVYSAGVLFFELLCNAYPVAPNDPYAGWAAWRKAHLTVPPRSVTSFRADVPPAIDQLIAAMLSKDPRKRPGDWSAVIEKLDASSAPKPVSANISGLIARATASHAERSATELAVQTAREEAAERSELLRIAFEEPTNRVLALVEAFNKQSSVGSLQPIRRAPTALDIRGLQGTHSLVVVASETRDLPLAGYGLVRMVGLMRVEPVPRPRNEREVFQDGDRIGGFNLLYVVRSEKDQFGDWYQLRFEHNPLSNQRSWPRWFALEFDALPRELQLLRAIGRFQSELKPLDDAWITRLLEFLV